MSYKIQTYIFNCQDVVFPQYLTYLPTSQKQHMARSTPRQKQIIPTLTVFDIFVSLSSRFLSSAVRSDGNSPIVVSSGKTTQSNDLREIRRLRGGSGMGEFKFIALFARSFHLLYTYYRESGVFLHPDHKKTAKNIPRILPYNRYSQFLYYAKAERAKTMRL